MKYDFKLLVSMKMPHKFPSKLYGKIKPNGEVCLTWVCLIRESSSAQSSNRLKSSGRKVVGGYPQIKKLRILNFMLIVCKNNLIA